MDDKIKKLIELYETILHGTNDNLGLFQCYDTYYKGSWDEKLKKIEKLKQELGFKQIVVKEQLKLF